ncbi:MAG: FAD-dependent oxidoreductase, partial [Polyangiales bacterium]
ELRFPEEARRMLFEVFAHSFFNPEDQYSAAELLEQFHFYFMGNPEGLVFDVMTTPFSEGLFGPLGRWLEARGARVRTGETVERIEDSGDDGLRVLAADGEPVPCDAAILALPVPALREVVGRSAELCDAGWRAQVDSLEVTRPFAVWRLWLDRPTAPGRHPFVGTAGLGPIDNVSLYHLFEDESRAWAERTGGAVVELHAYAVDEDAREAELREALLGALHRLYPETRAARIVEERWLWRRDCPAFPPGSWARRPGVRTPDPRVALAGDFVRLPFPSALMERATASGLLAANALLERWDVRGEPVWSVPTRGLLAPLSR